MSVGLHIARLVLAGVFILAGVLKLREPDAFAASVATFRVLPREWSNVVALGLPVLEVMCGLLLFAAAWRRAAALGLAVLSALFTILLLQGLWRGLNVDCGCFGKWDPAAGAPGLCHRARLDFPRTGGFLLLPLPSGWRVSGFVAERYRRCPRATMIEVQADDGRKGRVGEVLQVTVKQ